ncbi:hypothetical protein FOMPIDRAFT_1019697 [Fomitopsis schrenkii]|uniref:Uncharacterized protein n=1 Tax=Fomitopsis schrenkii TaxID=2126942 RepID=S8DNR2_FOMSC|nr:hypothetical protein FOMPIDRAFT_1019697 [Fomitopsis schrenkii]
MYSTLRVSDCTVNVPGLRSIKNHIMRNSELGSNPQSSARVASAALGFLLANARNDNRHHLAEQNDFHPDYQNVRRSWSDKLENWNFRQDVMHLGHDAFTMLDRINGGVSVTMTIAGGLPPGTRLEPQNLKVDVYLPPGLFDELPELQPALARIVQAFVENIGVPAAAQFLRCANTNNWSLASGDVRLNRPQDVLPIFPGDNGRCSSYTFWGRPVGELNTLLAEVGAASGGRRDSSAACCALCGCGARADNGSDSCRCASTITQLSDEVDRLQVDNQRMQAIVDSQHTEITVMRAAEKLRKDSKEVRYVYGPGTITPPVRAMPNLADTSIPVASKASTASHPTAPPASLNASPLLAKSLRSATARGFTKAGMPTSGGAFEQVFTPESSVGKGKGCAKDSVPASPAHTPDGVAYMSRGRGESTPMIPKLGSAFNTPVKSASRFKLSSSVHHLSPVSMSSESSVSPSSCPTLPSPVAERLATDRRHLIDGFGPCSARYLIEIGQPKFAHDTLDFIFKEFVYYVWPDQLKSRLSISTEQSEDLAKAMRADKREEERAAGVS